jgi:hypothetical protein
MHACHRYGFLARDTVIERYDTSPVDAPRHFVLVFAGRYSMQRSASQRNFILAMIESPKLR